jgi:predicted nuclease of predicted toxin-antitoxin system
VRLLVDQNLPRSLITQLAEASHDCVHASDLGLEKAADPDVFSACIEQERVLVTADKKLTKFLAASNAPGPSVVIVRGFGGPVSDLTDALVSALDLVAETIQSSFTWQPAFNGTAAVRMMLTDSR